jgi:hypothetical protein
MKNLITQVTGIVSQRKCGGYDAKCFALYILGVLM